MKYLFSIAVLLSLAVSPAFAQFYEYTDKNGNRVITDSPPPDAEAQEKKINEERLYRSTRSEKDYPAGEKKEGPPGTGGKEEKPKKNYNWVNVVMYMTDW